MSNKVLGILALIGAPWLFIGTTVEQRVPNLSDSWFTGVWGLFFISGWICSAVGLKRLKGNRNTSFGGILLIIMIASLTIANISNVVQIVVERNKPSYFMILDIFWPLSNIIMLIVGIWIITSRRLSDWKQYIPLATGLWFPLAIVSSFIDNQLMSILFGGFYSVVAWTLLAIVILTSKEESP